MFFYFKLLAFLWGLNFLHFALIFIYENMNRNVQQTFHEQINSEVDDFKVLLGLLAIIVP